jgi:hypothetical protein
MQSSNDTVYSRTAQGNAELSLRRSNLDALMNGLLMLVNGRRTRADLLSVASHMGAPFDSIDTLKAQGFIELAPRTGLTRPAPLATDHGALEADYAASQPGGDEWMLTDAERTTRLHRLLTEAASQHLGLSGFLYHLKVEKAASLAELRKLVTPIGDAIARAKGSQVAGPFLQRAGSL